MNCSPPSEILPERWLDCKSELQLRDNRAIWKLLRCLVVMDHVEGMSAALGFVIIKPDCVRENSASLSIKDALIMTVAQAMRCLQEEVQVIHTDMLSFCSATHNPFKRKLFCDLFHLHMPWRYVNHFYFERICHWYLMKCDIQWYFSHTTREVVEEMVDHTGTVIKVNFNNKSPHGTKLD